MVSGHVGWFLICAYVLNTAIAVDSFGSAQCYHQSALLSSLNLYDIYIYQSSGHCMELCAGRKIAATYDGDECFCGDEAPDTRLAVDLSFCDTKCVGFPDETCGSLSYFQVYNNNAIVALKHSDLSSSTSSLSEYVSSVALSNNTLTSSILSSFSSSLPFPSSSSISSSMAESLSPSIIYRTISALSTSSELAPNKADVLSESKGISTGGIVGAVVGLVGGVFLFIALVIWLLCYCRKKQESYGIDEEYNDEFTLLGPINEKEKEHMCIEPNPFLLAGGYNNFDTLQQQLQTQKSPYFAQDSFSSAQNSHGLYGHSRQNSHGFIYAGSGSGTAAAVMTTEREALKGSHMSKSSDGSALVDKACSGDPLEHTPPHPYTHFYNPGQEPGTGNDHLSLPQQNRRKLSTGSLPEMIVRQPGSLKVVNN